MCLHGVHIFMILTQSTHAVICTQMRAQHFLNKLDNSELDHDFHFAEMILSEMIHYVVAVSQK